VKLIPKELMVLLSTQVMAKNQQNPAISKLAG
jgi:hypothetical protein